MIKKRTIGLTFFFFIVSFVGILLIYISNSYQLPMGQDSEFHMARIRGLSNVFTSPVNFAAFGHQGNVMNIMYPWQTLYPAYFIYKITGNFKLSVYAFYFLVTFATLLISFYSMKKIKEQEFQAILFSLIYTFSSYRLSNLIFRSAIGEYLAMTFLPIVLLGVYKILCDDYKQYYFLSIGMALLACSHLLSVAMSTIFIALGVVLFLILGSKRKQWKQRIYSLIKAAILTLFLTLGILVPIFEQLGYQKLYFPPKFPFSPLEIKTLLFNAITSNISSFTIGSIIFAGIILVPFYLRKFNRFDKVIYGFGTIMFLGTSTIVPWSFLDKTPISSMQFIFRLNSYITLLIAYCLAIALGEIFKKKRLVALIGFTILLVLVHEESMLKMYKEETTERNVKNYSNEEILNLSQNFMHYDYTNILTYQNFDLLRNRPYFLGEQEIKVKEKINKNYIELSVMNDTKEKAELVTPILHFKGEKASINNKNIRIKGSQYGTAALQLPVGLSKVRIYYHYSFIERSAQLISILSILFLLLIIHNRRKER